MKQFLIKAFPYIGFSALALGVGWLVGWLTRTGLETVYPQLEKPALTPPGIVFPIVWGILYLLMGVSMAMVVNKAGLAAATPSLVLWVLQLALNFGWTILFFGLNLRGSAPVCLAILWLLVLDMILTMARVCSIAALLQVPYLLWLSFAAYLNAGIWLLNR